jgi:hypothetical protein
MKPFAPMFLILAAAMLLNACSSDDGMWGHRRHDRDHDGDRHIMGALTPAPAAAGG